MLESVASFLEFVFAVPRNLIDKVTFWRLDYDEPDLPMRQELSTVKQKIADMTTQKKRLEMQKSRMEEEIKKTTKNRLMRLSVRIGKNLPQRL